MLQRSGTGDFGPVLVRGRERVPLCLVPRTDGAVDWGDQALEMRDQGNPRFIPNPVLEIGDGMARPPGEDRASLMLPMFRAVADALRGTTIGSTASLPVWLHLHPAVPAYAKPILEQKLTEVGLEIRPTPSMHESWVKGAVNNDIIKVGRRVLFIDAGYGDVYLSIVLAGASASVVKSAVLKGLGVDDRAELLAEMLIRRAVGHQARVEPSELLSEVARFLPRARALLAANDATGAPLRHEISYRGKSYREAMVSREDLDARRSANGFSLIERIKDELRGQSFDEVRIVSPLLWTAELQKFLGSYVREGQLHQCWDQMLQLAALGGEAYVVASKPDAQVTLPPAESAPFFPAAPKFHTGQPARTAQKIGAATWTPTLPTPAVQPPAVGARGSGTVESITSRRTTIKLSSGAMVVFEGYNVPLPGGEIHILRLEEHVEVRVVRHDPDGFARVEVFPPKGKARGSFAAHGVSSGQPVRGQGETPPLRILARHSGPVWSVAISPDGTRAVSGGDDRRVHSHDMESGAKVGSPLEHEKPVFAVAWSPNGARLLVATGDAARLWNMSARTATGLSGHRTSVLAATWSPDGKRIVTGGTDRTVRIWDGASAALLDTIEIGIKRVRDLAVSPDRTRIAVVGAAADISIIDLRSQAVSTLSGHRANVSRVVWSPDGHIMATGDSIGEIRLWHVASDESRTPIWLSTLVGHGGEITGLAFTPDGELLLSAGKDRTLREWPLMDANETPTIKSIDVDELTCLALSADGSACAMGSGDGRVVLLRRPKTTRRVSPAPSTQPVAQPVAKASSQAASQPPSAVAYERDEVETWETVKPSDAVSEAPADLTDFNELIDAVMEYGAIDIPIRQLISMFGAERRGSRVVAKIREAFEADGLGYSDAIERADIDALVRLSTAPAAVVSAEEH